MTIAPIPTRRDVLFTGAALLATPAFAATPAPDWTKLPTEPYRGKQDDIAFATPDIGWYGNGQGKLYGTTDGGRSWAKLLDKPGTFVRALGLIDAQRGFLGNVGMGSYPGVTDRNPLYRTIDGGRSWTAVTAPGIEKVAGICGIDILPISRIFQGEMQGTHLVHAAGRVNGPATILRSEDAGETWSVLDLTGQAAMILDVKFLDERTGFVAAAGPAAEGQPAGEALILRTGDGGRNWTPVYRSGRPLENVWKMSWPSRRVGYGSVQSYDPANPRRVVVKTTDGGRSWRELPLIERAKTQEFGIGFVDERRGWVGCTQGGFETRDGGKSWTPATFGPAVNKIRIVRGGGVTRAFAIGVDVHRLDLA